MDLALIWGALLSFIIIVYVILDGFDLGIGILFPLAQNNQQRDIMMSTIFPVWDGNETWLVLGGAALYGAFPLAYSTLLPTLYMPIMLMLAALIFRGIAFEFRFKAGCYRILWDISFCGGSLIAGFMQGLILGTFVQGYAIPSSEAYQWLTPFSVMTGCAVVIGYALLGATFLIAKTLGDLQARMYVLAKPLLLGVAFFMVVVSVWTPLIEPSVMQRWFSWPNMLYLAPLPMTAALTFFLIAYSLFKRWEFLPFYLIILEFILAYIGFCISLWPYLVPRSITIWQAAAPPSTLRFLLTGISILLPILLVYTAYSYRVFRGKVTTAEHHY